jgi:hypothetical protein
LAFAGVGACNLELSHDVEARGEWKRTYPLARGASLEIRNTNGKIRIVPAEGDVLEVKADRIVKAPTDEAAKAALARFEIVERVTPKGVVLDGSGSGIGSTLNLSRRADFEVHLPRWADVRLGATNGEIEVSGLRGMFHAETTNGRITGSALEGGALIETTNGEVTIDFAKLGEAGITCTTTNGTINVTVPRDTNARLSARVMNGSINRNNLPVSIVEESHRRLDGTIGSGGPSIKLETTNGSISINGR